MPLESLREAPGDLSSIESIDLASGSATRHTFETPSRDALWSPDGMTIFFLEYKASQGEIYQTPADWSTPPVLVQRAGEAVLLSDYHPAHQTLLLYISLDRARTLLKRGASGWEPGKFPDRWGGALLAARR
jgi:hypothetical protein